MAEGNRPLTPERLAEIREAERAATPGPWWYEPLQKKTRPDGSTYYIGDEVVYGDPDDQQCQFYLSQGGNGLDNEFIALARQAIPELIQEVGRLRGQLEKSQEVRLIWSTVANDRDAEVRTLTAENARLRSALENMGIYVALNLTIDADELLRMIRDALKGRGEGAK